VFQELIAGSFVKSVCSYYSLVLSLESVAYRVVKGIFPSKPDPYN
jgi:hypothetical protein